MKMVTIQHPIKMYGLKDETLAFRSKTTHFYGADKARSASARPHEQAAKRLRMRVLNSYQKTNNPAQLKLNRRRAILYASTQNLLLPSPGKVSRNPKMPL